MEALLSATAWGGADHEAWASELGHIREGCLADLLLVDGDPLADIRILQDKHRILAVMKDGEFHRAPPLRACAAAPRAGSRRCKERRMADRPLHQRPHHRRQRRAARTPARCWCRATASAASAARRARRAGGRDGDRRRRRHADARHVRGAHALLRGTTPPRWPPSRRCRSRSTRCGRAGGEALPRPRLDVVRRRGLRQAAARLRDPQRHQLGADPGAALPGGEPGDHGARRRSATRRCRTCRSRRFSFGVNVDGADEMRKAVRMFLKYGVDSIKLNLSGDNLVPGADAKTTWMTRRGSGGRRATR